MNPNKKRLRRTMMFLNAQKPGLIKDPYIYKPDSIMLDLLQKTRKMQPDFLFIMHLRRLIIEDVNVLSELTDWTLLTGKKISAAQ